MGLRPSARGRRWGLRPAGRAPGEAHGLRLGGGFGATARRRGADSCGPQVALGAARGTAR